MYARIAASTTAIDPSSFVSFLVPNSAQPTVNSSTSTDSGYRRYFRVPVRRSAIRTVRCSRPSLSQLRTGGTTLRFDAKQNRPRRSPVHSTLIGLTLYSANWKGLSTPTGSSSLHSENGRTAPRPQGFTLRASHGATSSASHTDEWQQGGGAPDPAFTRRELGRHCCRRLRRSHVDGAGLGPPGGP